MNARRTVHVTDHAIVRLIERGYGKDIAAIREAMERYAADAVEIGAIDPPFSHPVPCVYG